MYLKIFEVFAAVKANSSKIIAAQNSADGIM